MSPQKTPVFNAEESRDGNEIGNWLRRERIRQGLNQKELAALLEGYGVKLGSGALSKWEGGDHIPTPYQLQALCCAMNTDGPFDRFRGLNEAGIAKVNAYARDLAATGLYDPAPETIQMKVYDMPASAGTGLMLEGEEYRMLSVPAGSVPAGADFGIRVRGDSMTPRFQNGQIVWVKRQNELRDGEFGIFILDGEAFLKQLRYAAPSPKERESYGSGIGTIAVLNSLNPAYKPRRVAPTQRLDLVGKVLE